MDTSTRVNGTRRVREHSRGREGEREGGRDIGRRREEERID